MATLQAAEKPRIQAEDYTIEAKVSPQSHKLTARAVVKFVALDDISIATFELHNALRVTQVTDEQGTCCRPSAFRRTRPCAWHCPAA